MQKFRFQAVSQRCRAILIHPERFKKSSTFSRLYKKPLIFLAKEERAPLRGIVTLEDAEKLLNRGLPFFVNMTCLNGYFQDVYDDPLAEALLKAPQRGAIAIWTSSGLTEPDEQAVMNKELIKLLFNNRESLTLGEATPRAKASVNDSDNRKTWILFGDPTTRLRP